MQQGEAEGQRALRQRQPGDQLCSEQADQRRRGAPSAAPRRQDRRRQQHEHEQQRQAAMDRLRERTGGIEGRPCGQQRLAPWIEGRPGDGARRRDAIGPAGAAQTGMRGADQPADRDLGEQHQQRGARRDALAPWRRRVGGDRQPEREREHREAADQVRDRDRRNARAAAPAAEHGEEQGEGEQRDGDPALGAQARRLAEAHHDQQQDEQQREDRHRAVREPGHRRRL